MEKPDLNRMWEIWVRIGLPNEVPPKRCINVIQSRVCEVISILKRDGIINWYQFLIHNRNNDPNLYYHIRFALRKGVDSKAFLESLPDYCLFPKPIKRKNGESISGINKSILKNEEIEEAWRIIGEQSEWIIHMLNIHKDANIPITQITQFMHYFLNMLGLGRQAILFLSPFINF